MLNSYLNVANRIITTINVAISPVIPASRASKIMRDSMGLTSFPIWIGRVTHVSLFFYYLGKNTPTEKNISVGDELPINLSDAQCNLRQLALYGR